MGVFEKSVSESEIVGLMLILQIALRRGAIEGGHQGGPVVQAPRSEARYTTAKLSDQHDQQECREEGAYVSHSESEEIVQHVLL